VRREKEPLDVLKEFLGYIVELVVEPVDQAEFLLMVKISFDQVT
jgi:hypothetical protein